MTLPQWSSIAIFAEDLRQEVNGQVTIVGILPDNINFDVLQQDVALQLMMPKLGVYVRTQIEIDTSPTELLAVEIRDPNGQTMVRNEVASSMLTSEREKSKDQGSSVFTIISQIMTSPFVFPIDGEYKVIVNYGGDERMAGFIRVIRQ